MTDQDTNTAKIAALNDRLRTTGYGGRTMITRGIADLDPDTQLRIHRAIRSFDQFTEDDDPYGEHDFGAVDIDGMKIFFKIDYYAPDMQTGSEDPADPTRTCRVLTILLASEW